MVQPTGMQDSSWNHAIYLQLCTSQLQDLTSKTRHNTDVHSNPYNEQAETFHQEQQSMPSDDPMKTT